MAAFKALSKIVVVETGIWCAVASNSMAYSRTVALEVHVAYLNVAVCFIFCSVASRLPDRPEVWLLGCYYWCFVLSLSSLPFIFMDALQPQDMVTCLVSNLVTRIQFGLFCPDVRITCGAEVLAFASSAAATI